MMSFLNQELFEVCLKFPSYILGGLKFPSLTQEKAEQCDYT